MRSTSPSRSRGFSLVELLVAVLFTGLLMAGMATVFKASLGTFATSSEMLSSSRRNRMSLDMLYDDLNQAGALPTSLMLYPTVDPTIPPFIIRPNQAYTGTDVTNPLTDELCFYYDEILPFAGTLNKDVDSTAMGTMATGAEVNFRDDQASQVQAGMVMISRANADFKRVIAGVSGSSTLQLTFAGASEEVATPGAFSMGGNVRLLSGTEVLVVRPKRYARYTIQARNLDPENPGVGIPCLVREEVEYGRPFDAAEPSYSTALITENVTKFKVYLSADGGRTWAGTGDPGPASWDEIAAGLNAQLAAVGRPGYTNVSSGSFWFREIPVVVRVDVTTRTVRQRTEYSANPAAGTPAYKEQTQSLVLVPRHFGLPYGQTLTGA
jgi:hypothetical protein